MRTTVTIDDELYQQALSMADIELLQPASQASIAEERILIEQQKLYRWRRGCVRAPRVYVDYRRCQTLDLQAADKTAGTL